MFMLLHNVNVAGDQGKTLVNSDFVIRVHVREGKTVLEMPNKNVLVVSESFAEVMGALRPVTPSGMRVPVAKQLAKEEYDGDIW